MESNIRHVLLVLIPKNKIQGMWLFQAATCGFTYTERRAGRATPITPTYNWTSTQPYSQSSSLSSSFLESLGLLGVWVVLPDVAPTTS